MPMYATLFLIITLSSVGLPLMNGFVGEFLVLNGAFSINMTWGALAASGVIWSAAYMLWMYQRVFYGKVTHEVNNTLPDASLMERAAIWPMAALALIMGIMSPYWMNAISPAVRAAIAAPAAKTAPAQLPTAMTRPASTVDSQGEAR